MAQKVIRVCDLHDDETAGSETIRFAIDGAGYEIDVCDVHARDLRDALEPYVAGARRAGVGAAAASRGRGRARQAAPSGGAKTAEIRSWARSQGFQVNERGRIPAQIMQEYEKAHA